MSRAFTFVQKNGALFYSRLMLRSFLWWCRGDSWFTTQIERASIAELELLLGDVKRHRKIPAAAIETVVDRCWQSLNVCARPPLVLWSLLLETTRLHPRATFDFMTSRFQCKCTETAVQYFDSFLDELYPLDLKVFSTESLKNFVSVIEAGNLKFSCEAILGALELLSDDSPDQAWRTFAAMVDHVDVSNPMAGKFVEKLDRLYCMIMICCGDAKFFALKALGSLTRLTDKRYTLPARVKDELDHCTVDFGETQRRLGNAFTVSKMFTFE